MQKEDYKLFPTLVTKYKNFLTEDVAQEIFEYCKNTDVSKAHDAWIGNGTSSHQVTKNVLEDIQNNVLSCTGIINDIEFYVNSYSKTFGYHRTLEILNSWFNIQQKNSVLKMHTHPHSIFSAALFVKCDKDSSKLVFENPNANIAYLNSALEGNVDHQYGLSVYDSFVFEPSVGDLILFPSWLRHGSWEEINQGADRMTISFNCRFVPL